MRNLANFIPCGLFALAQLLGTHPAHLALFGFLAGGAFLWAVTR